MAGLFDGLVNYDKPGPGVDKNEPKKKGFKLFFSILFDKFWKFIPLSLLYILTALPILTIGFSEAATAFITRNFARRKPVLLVSDYFDTIKKNWKQSLIVGLINLLVTVFMIGIIYFYYMGWPESLFYKIGFVLTCGMFIVFTFLKYYINMLIVTFDLKIKQLYKNSLLLSSAGLKENIIITLSLLVIYGILFGVPVLWYYIADDMILFVISLVLTILFLPGVRAFVIQFWIFPIVKKHMIDPYYESHPEQNEERNLLNLQDDDEEENDEGEDKVFKDIGTKEVAISNEQKHSNHIPKQYNPRHQHSADDDDDTI